MPSKLRFSAKCSFFGQSLSRGHYQPIYQPPEGVYLLNIPAAGRGLFTKYAYQSYQHLMIQIKTTLRLGQYNIQNLVNSISNLDNFFVDICPLVDKYKKDYYKKYRDDSTRNETR